MEQLDVSQVMQKVLGYLNGIAEHVCQPTSSSKG